MNLHTKHHLWQVIWWGRRPTFRCWTYPEKYTLAIFDGYYFGLFEIRRFR